MKIILDIISLLAFLLIYFKYGIYNSVLFIVIFYAIVLPIYILYHYKKTHEIDKISLASFLLVTILGTITLFTHDIIFFKIKPTVIYLLFAISLQISSAIKNKRNLFEYMMEKNITLPKFVWQNINRLWIITFYILGISNAFIAYFYSTEIWVYFKTIGCISFLIIICILQAVYILKYAEEVDE